MLNSVFERAALFLFDFASISKYKSYRTLRYETYRFVASYYSDGTVDIFFLFLASIY